MKDTTRISMEKAELLRTASLARQLPGCSGMFSAILLFVSGVSF